MTLEVEATYENGILKLDRELPLPNGQRLKLTVQTPGGRAKGSYGMFPWTGDREELRRFLNDPEEGQWGSRDV
jgi:predicted DNA-binding antitoxin AbrB/MazE fold protein